MCKKSTSFIIIIYDRPYQQQFNVVTIELFPLDIVSKRKAIITRARGWCQTIRADNSIKILYQEISPFLKRFRSYRNSEWINFITLFNCAFKTPRVTLGGNFSLPLVNTRIILLGISAWDVAFWEPPEQTTRRASVLKKMPLVFI